MRNFSNLHSLYFGKYENLKQRIVTVDPFYAIQICKTCEHKTKRNETAEIKEKENDSCRLLAFSSDWARI